MRKEAKTENHVTISNIQDYHERSDYNANYAFCGWTQNKYFTSDRYEPLDENFHRASGAPLMGYGLEIETECRGIRNSTVLAEVFDKIIFPKFPADLFKMQYDGSLGGDTSAECITQPMTKAFIRNHYKDFKTMFNTYFPSFYISADSATTNCGMHVNISNALFGKTVEKQTEAIRKLFYIVNRHYNLCCGLFYRAGSTGYCGQMGYTNARTMTLGRGDHGSSMNMSHFYEGRIELRLPGGQRNYACFRNTMESVFFLVDRVKTITWDECDDVKAIFKGCNQYVYDRLSTRCGLSANVLGPIHETMVTEELL